jgi:Flp pilus assembly protein TadG
VIAGGETARETHRGETVKSIVRLMARGGWARTEGGQSLAEFALLLPLLLAVLVGSFDVVRVLGAAILLQTAVQAGAQYGALSAANAANTGAIESVVRAEATIPQAGPANPAVSSATSTDANGELQVTVQATFTHSTLFAWPAIPSVYAITRASVAQVRR